MNFLFFSLKIICRDETLFASQYTPRVKNFQSPDDNMNYRVITLGQYIIVMVLCKNLGGCSNVLMLGRTAFVLIMAKDDDAFGLKGYIYYRGNQS